jgi:alkylation response protein AidB-like acyl-CoA dehydrogenase
LWGVGADIVAEAIREFRGEKLKQEIVVPLLQGKLYAVEGLTEPGAVRTSSGPPPRPSEMGTVSASPDRNGSS